MAIGAVLAALREDFPDITISKIRFLEDEGLIKPERTSSGYRKFSREDVGRLRYVLAAQRDHYLPLRGRPRWARSPQLPSSPCRAPVRNTRRYLPICTSSPPASAATSIRSRLR